MKYLYLVFALFCSTVAAAQTTAPSTGLQVFKKANAMLIQTPDSPRVALRKLAAVLQERGYVVEKIDDELNSLVTRGKALRRTTALLTINAFFAPQGIVLRGQYHLEAAGVVVDNPAEFTGMEGGTNKVAFREVEAIAKAYPSTSGIRYEAR